MQLVGFPALRQTGAIKQCNSSLFTRDYEIWCPKEKKPLGVNETSSSVLFLSVTFYMLGRK